MRELGDLSIHMAFNELKSNQKMRSISFIFIPEAPKKKEKKRKKRKKTKEKQKNLP